MIGWRGNTNAEPDDDADDDPIVMRAQSGQQPEDGGMQINGQTGKYRQDCD